MAGMPLVPVHAYAFANTFKLRDLIQAFTPESGARIEKDRLLATYGPGHYAVAYDFGAVVFVGMDSGDAKKVIEAIARLNPEPNPPIEENFIIDVSPGAAIDVRFDKVVVPDLTVPVVDIVAEVLAQSTAMDYYAKDVEEIETETDRITAVLQKKGKVPGRIRGLVQFVGLCIATRNDIISTLALFDKPEATWESEELDRLWNGLHKMLEMDDRYRALEAKLRMFQENLEVLVDLSRQRQTVALEFAVVILILMEMLIMTWQVVTSKGSL